MFIYAKPGFALIYRVLYSTYKVYLESLCYLLLSLVYKCKTRFNKEKPGITIAKPGLTEKPGITIAKPGFTEKLVISQVKFG